MLHTETRGQGPPVALIHGFTQSGSSWEPVAAVLAATRTVITVDAPGHGRSSGVRAGLWDGAELIGEACGRAAYAGYSMGGRFALHLALSRPDLVERLVLISASAGIDSPAERAARREADEERARRAETDGVEAFVRWWLTLPLFASLPSGAAAVGSRLGGSPEGLASSLRLAGAGVAEPLWDRLGELRMPVLVMAGALDGAYTRRARRLVEGIGPAATLHVVEGAGHACHLERPGEVAAVIAAWLGDPAGA